MGNSISGITGLVAVAGAIGALFYFRDPIANAIKSDSQKNAEANAKDYETEKKKEDDAKWDKAVDKGLLNAGVDLFFGKGDTIDPMRGTNLTGLTYNEWKRGIKVKNLNNPPKIILTEKQKQNIKNTNSGRRRR